MAIRVYLMPMIIAERGRPGTMRRLPKYLGLLAGNCTCLRYGAELVCLLVADVTDAEHTAIAANADVRAFPADLDTAVTGQARVQLANALEALDIPAQWVNGQSFRVVLRRLRGVFDLACNLEGSGLSLPKGALDSQLNALPAQARAGLLAAAGRLGLDTAGINGNSTLRAALAALGAQSEQRPVVGARAVL
jgi:hypothetical protein